MFIFAKFDAEIRAVLGFLSACTGLTLLPGDANLPVTGQIHRLFKKCLCNGSPLMELRDGFTAGAHDDPTVDTGRARTSGIQQARHR